MTGAVKNLARGILNALNIRITKNQEYDYQAYRIMQENLQSGSNAIDIGCHKGEFLDHFLKFSPAGTHFAFEPIPFFYDMLQQKYGHNVKVFPYALSNSKSTTKFNYVKNAPAFSGLRKREYNVQTPEIDEIDVQTEMLDNLIPVDIPINFIKIDVEGAEFLVLQGATQIIKKNKPLVIFEFGLGASDYYKVQPSDIYKFFIETCGMNISLMKDYLQGNRSLTFEDFSNHYFNRTEYYFVAHP